MNEIKKDSIVEYINPLQDEISLTFKVIDIDINTNWCLLEVNVNMNIKPTYTANISDLRCITF